MTASAFCPNCICGDCDALADDAKCSCGRMFPSTAQLLRHVARDACLGAREYARVGKPVKR